MTIDLDTWLRDAGHVATSFVHHKGHGAPHILNPLRCFGSTNNITDTSISVQKALAFAKQAADPVFLAVPQGMTQKQALASANRFTFHLDSAAKAVARLSLALKYVS